MFNPQSLGDLAAEYAKVSGFDPDLFLAQALPGLQGRALLERLDWIADCIEVQLSSDFPTLADQLETAMPDPLDPTLGDDDFGRFIHAVPGVLAVRHGLQDHPARALDLLWAATQRFSMEFYIRPFLNTWPDQTLARLRIWVGDDNYHVRRLVSEGTRARLPWAKAITLDPLLPLEFLTDLHADPTRYVTRSVANHLNDISKIEPRIVIETLDKWIGQNKQNKSEMAWMRRHALRTLLKEGHPDALAHMGYTHDPTLGPVTLHFPQSVAINDTVPLSVSISAPQKTPVLVDYRMSFPRAKRTITRKYRVKDTCLMQDEAVTLSKRHNFKGGASTFTLTPGPGILTVTVNGTRVATHEFDLI